MIYISEINKEEDFLTEKQIKYPKILRKIIYFTKVKFKKINSKFVENNEIIYISNDSKEKVIEYLIKKNERTVCLSSYLAEKNDVLKILEDNNIKILNGRWLFKYIAIKIIEYVLLEQNKKINQEEIAIVTNDTDDVIIETILELAKSAKIIHIITDERNKFENIENKLYDEFGIMINVSNNYRKSLSKVNTIINYNFSEEELNKYSIPKYAVIINMKEKVTIHSKSFEGLNINYYQIFMPKNYIKYMKYFQNFDQTILYESYIYRKDTYKNIIKKLEEDKIKICTLVGNKGNIKKYEYDRLNKNMLNNQRKIAENLDKNVIF